MLSTKKVNKDVVAVNFNGPEEIYLRKSGKAYYNTEELAVCFEQTENGTQMCVNTAVLEAYGISLQIINTRQDNRDEVRDELDEYLNGLRICDDITFEDQEEILDDFDEWCKDASIGDIYCYDSREFKLAPAV